MEESNLRTVRVYTKKYSSKDKDGNVIEKESKQKQVSLKKDDPFEDNELVVVLKEEEYKDLLANNRKDFEDIINEIVNFSDLMEKRMYFDRNDNSNIKKVQMTITKMKKNAEEQTGDTKVYIDTIYVYR